MSLSPLGKTYLKGVLDQFRRDDDEQVLTTILPKGDVQIALTAIKEAHEFVDNIPVKEPQP